MGDWVINRANENKFTILIADRNSNVREFLKREMMTEGYRVRLAKDSREVLKWAFSQAPLLKSRWIRNS